MIDTTELRRLRDADGSKEWDYLNFVGYACENAHAIADELDALRKRVAELEQERLLLARLSADTPQFNNPLHVYAAKELRDAVLSGRETA